MKRLLLLLTIAFYATVQGQITLEHTYHCQGGAFNNYPGTFAFFAGGSMKYYTTNADTNELKIYDASHNLMNTINVNIMSGYKIKTLFLITDHLFNSDDNLEYIIVSYNQTAHTYNMSLYDETGQNIFDFGNHWEAFVIKQDDTTYKLMTTDVNDARDYNIWSLPGTLSAVQEQTYLKGFAYPVPASRSIHIANYSVSMRGSNLYIYNMNGKLVLQRAILNKNDLNVDISGFSNGTYIYKIGDMQGKFVKK